jgi:hypothetical protein
VSKWSRKVAAALRKPEVRAGIAQLFAANMRKHIDENYGRGDNGEPVAHKPLKPLFGKKWVGGKKPTESFVYETGGLMLPNGAWSTTKFDRLVQSLRRRRRTKSGKMVKTTRHEVLVPSYRNGGQPLRNTGQMYRSLKAKGERTSTGFSVALTGLKHALYQDKGFKTSGPNYIPLTRKGARNHATGANPATEGLKRGRDWLKAKSGVTVPSRPFLMPTNDEMRDIGVNISMTLKFILKGN